MQKGDIILVPFPFTDLSGNKLRPAVVLAETVLDVIVCFVTTQLQWQEEKDIILTPTEANGIKKKSLIRVNKITTLDKALALGKIGSLSEADIEKLNSKIKNLLQL